jgi:glycosyltransferase involved in cell wall biosynthesis
VHTEHGKHYAHSLKARILGRFGARYTQRFFCVSNDVAQEVRSCRVASAGKIAVVYNGIRTDHFRPRTASAELRARYGIPADALVLGTVGRLAEIKRQDILIRGFAKLRSQVPNLHLLLVGDGVMREPLSDLAADLGIGEFVHFAGYQSDTASYLGLMSVFALTSRSEGMPLGILEAWAAGVPVVASRVGGVPELIEHDRNGLLFDAGDVDGFAATSGRLFNDPVLREELRTSALQGVRRDFDLRTMAHRYDQEYRRLLSDVRVF